MSDIAPHHDHQSQEIESELLLEEMGYQPQLQRGLNILGNLALTLSDITPTASLLVVGTAVIATAGTGSLWAYLIGAFIAINVALCMGELGSMFPVAGGLYSIVTRVLGRPVASSRCWTTSARRSSCRRASRSGSARTSTRFTPACRPSGLRPP